MIKLLYGNFDVEIKCILIKITMNRSDFIEQSNAYQSGLTCLSMICRHYGRYIDLTATSPQKISLDESLQQVSNKAGELGLSSVIGYLPVAKLSKVTLPCILYWENKYFVVLRKVKHKSYYIADPIKGITKYNEADMKRYWICSRQEDYEDKGRAIFIKPSDEFYSQAEAQNQLIKENSIWRYIKNLLCGKNSIL